MKHSHQSVDYTENAQWAPRIDCDDECSNCVNFIPMDRNSECRHVESPINPSGWCRRYIERQDIYVKDRE